jgi:hypothetical protein
MGSSCSLVPRSSSASLLDKARDNELRLVSDTIMLELICIILLPRSFAVLPRREQSGTANVKCHTSSCTRDYYSKLTVGQPGSCSGAVKMSVGCVNEDSILSD